MSYNKKEGLAENFLKIEAKSTMQSNGEYASNSMQ